MKGFAGLIIACIVFFIVYKIGQKVGYLKAKKERRDLLLEILVDREEERIKQENQSIDIGRKDD